MYNTLIFDLDGTLVIHNGYLKGKDIVLVGVKKFFSKIPESDFILILTARDEKYKKQIEQFLFENGLRFDQIIYGVPVGERILFNDRKPSGLQMAYAVNSDRNQWSDLEVEIDQDL